MKHFAYSILAALLVVLAVTVSPARADDCDDLADALGKIKKGGEFAALYFGDCKDIDIQQVKQVVKSIDSFASVVAKIKKIKKLFKKLRKSLQGRAGERDAVLPADDPADARIGFSGKDGFPLGALDILRRDSGPFDLRVTVLVGPDGLTDGGAGGSFNSTAGLLRLDRPPFDEATSSNAVSTLLIATWNEAAHGFTVSAQNDGFAAVGTPRIVADTYQVDLRMQQTATTFTMFTRATPADHASPDGWVTVFTTALPVPTTPFSFGLVGRGIDQKATVTFDFIRFTGPNIGGATERPLANQIGSDVINPLIDARTATQAPSPDLAAAATALQLAADGATTVQTAIAAAQAAGSLQASTQAALAQKALAKAAKAALDAKKKADQGDVKKAAAIAKSIVAAGGSAVTAIADLFGFSAKSVKDIPLGRAP